MNRNHKEPAVLISSFILAVLIMISSFTGIFFPGFYSRETANWQAQSIGQDMIDLFIAVPFLVITAIFAYKKNKRARLLWGGVLIYLVYTFTIYCFDIHFNRLFIVYCFTLGLSFYSFIYFLFLQLKQAIPELKNSLPGRITAIYFLVISIGFYFFWLSDIIPPAIQNKIPKTLIDVGLPTNPVHVIDLSLFLPALFITAILLLQKKPFAYIFVPVFLVFFILMDITIGTLIIVMKIKGLQADLSVTIAMGILSVWSAILLTWFLKKINT